MTDAGEISVSYAAPETQTEIHGFHLDIESIRNRLDEMMTEINNFQHDIQKVSERVDNSVKTKIK